jgi:hypothetical protein
LPLARRAAAQRGAEQSGERAKRKSNPESHDGRLNEPSGSRNRGLLTVGAGAKPPAKTGLEIRRRAAQINGRARVAEWQTRQT